MKIVKKFGAQGDVVFIHRGKYQIPAGATAAKREGGKLIVTHSETGHHHATLDPKAMMFDVDQTLSFLRMGDEDHLEIEHFRPFDTHETLSLRGEPGDVWEIRKQREHTPEGWRRVMD